MMGKRFDTGVVSWTTFETLFEHQHDLHRKLRFLVRAGNALREECLALEMVNELLGRQETELHDIRRSALSEREEAGGPDVEVAVRSEKAAPDLRSIDREYRALIGKLLEISKSGGHAWENVKAIIEGTYVTLDRSGEPNRH
jgi:hypothetical protein